MLTEEYSEFICKECHGTGRVRIKNARSYKLKITCPKCHGAGKLDWIEYITGEHYKTKKIS